MSEIRTDMFPDNEKEKKGLSLKVHALIGAIFLDPSLSSDRDNSGPMTVPEGEIFVLGDNRDNSNDSRFFGTVKERDVHAKVRIIYWSWDKEEGSVRWERIGQLIE